MELNNEMKKQLELTGIHIPVRFNSLHPGLKQIADSELIEVEGCFFLKALLKQEYDIKNALEEEDRTGVECSINNLYVQSIIYSNPYKESVDYTYVLKQGISYAYYLAKRLSSHGNFEVILSCTVENNPKEIIDCSVRFHLVRNGESWLSENIDEYIEEAILVLNTNENFDDKLL